MPSSKDRRRVEIAADLYDRLRLLAASEERALTSVIHDLLQLGLAHYQSTWLPHFYRDRFNALAQQALTFAQDEARQFGHDYVGTEHLLLGLLRQNEGIAAQVLGQLWIDLDRTRKGLDYIMKTHAAKMQAAANASVTPAEISAIPPSNAATATPAAGVTPLEEAEGAETRAEPTSDTGYTPRMRKVLALAVDEAQRLGHDYVGTEHLLLALEREGEGLAAGLLRTFGALGRIREFTLAALRQRASGSGPDDVTAAS